MRHRIAGIAVVTMLLMGVAATSVIGQPVRSDPLEVAKSTDPKLGKLIAEAHERSATFRRLVEEIRLSQWLVFVQPGPCPDKSAIACLLHFVGTHNGSPYLRVVVNHSSRDPDNVIGMLAHELQHVVEVVQEAGVIDASDSRALFRRIGMISVNSKNGTAYETKAAQQIGEQVLRELRLNGRDSPRAQPSDASTEAAMPRLRGIGAYASELLVEGACRSATFRNLVTRLNESDLIVYIAPHRFDVIALRGGLQYLATTQTNRILRVALDIRFDRRQMIATLGHELQHAVEIADARTIRTHAELEAFYRQHGVRGAVADAYDTQKARDAESNIRAELRTAPSSCPFDSPCD